MSKIVLTLSGGMDSSILLHMAVDKGYTEIYTVSFYYGQRHRRELDCVSKQIQTLISNHPYITVNNRVLDVSYIKNIANKSSLTNHNIANPNIKEMAGDAQPVSYVPFRNLMFLSIASAYAETLECDTI